MYGALVVLHVKWERGNGLWAEWKSGESPRRRHPEIIYRFSCSHLFEPCPAKAEEYKNERLEFINTPFEESWLSPCACFFFLIDHCKFVWRQFHFHAAWRHTRRMRNVHRAKRGQRRGRVVWNSLVDLFSGSSISFFECAYLFVVWGTRLGGC